MKILVINGPNINMLGIREPDIYGKTDYNTLCRQITEKADKERINIEIFQSNYEGRIIDKIQESYNNTDGIVINPAAFTHTSIAIADALSCVKIPYVEVHISDVSKRESFRQISFIRDNAVATIAGKGTDGYISAIDILIKEIKNDC